MSETENASRGLTRRGFVGAVASLGLAAGLTGCSPQNSKANASDSSEPNENSAFKEETVPEPSSTKQADVVVVGAGAAGLSAAVRAAEQGLNVIVMERFSTAGGTAALTEGMFAVESSIQKDMGITTTRDEVFTKCMNYHHYVNDARIMRTFVDKSASTIDWLLDEGVTFQTVEPLGNSLPTWHIFEGLSKQAMATMYDKAVEKGVGFEFETTAKKLNIEDGKVTGVVGVTKNGESLLVEAPVAIMCGGGYANSKELFNEFTHFDFDSCYARGLEGREGDGIKMGLNAGAALHVPGALMLCGGIVEGTSSLGDQVFALGGAQPSLWVNQNGKRFVSEDVAFDFSCYGNSVANQAHAFSIVDSNFVDIMVNQGCIMGTGMYIPIGTKLDKLPEDLPAAVKNDEMGVFQADTIEELAEQLGVDGATLKQTVDNYNQYCADGFDPEFGKTKDLLIPMAKAPFYGFKLRPAYFTTVGGLKVDENSRVINEDGQAISGLYACGSDAGGVYGDGYDVGIAAGSQMGWAINSGKYAAEDAKSYLSA